MLKGYELGAEDYITKAHFMLVFSKENGILLKNTDKNTEHVSL